MRKKDLNEISEISQRKKKNLLFKRIAKFALEKKLNKVLKFIKNSTTRSEVIISNMLINFITLSNLYLI